MSQEAALARMHNPSILPILTYVRVNRLCHMTVFRQMIQVFLNKENVSEF